ncbi:hypothetical protein [Streptomyces sp. NPDC056524]|uniref:hypothetical protein n=1 Tax=Streptomyces sp. NPDC056524 TaxID=3345851 RepID=UPI00368A2DD8
MSDRDNLGGVTIGAREIYDELVAMRGDVRSLTQTRESVDKALENHGERLTALERWKYGLPATAVTAVGALVLSFMRGSGKA